MRISDWSSDVCSSYLASRLAELERIPLPLYTLEQIELSETYHIFRTELARRGPKPTIAPEQIEEMRHTWHQLTPGEEVTCPKCQHEFVPGRPEGLVEPEWSLAELKAQEQMQTRWADPLAAVLKPDAMVERPEKERLAQAQAEGRR